MEEFRWAHRTLPFNDSMESASFQAFSVQPEPVLQQAAEIFTLEQIQPSIDPSLSEGERDQLMEVLNKYPSIWQVRSGEMQPI